MRRVSTHRVASSRSSRVSTNITSSAQVAQSQPAALVFWPGLQRQKAACLLVAGTG
jgi:hypothetical protein